jgi:hypothetical protein
MRLTAAGWQNVPVLHTANEKGIEQQLPLTFLPLGAAGGLSASGGLETIQAAVRG